LASLTVLSRPRRGPNRIRSRCFFASFENGVSGSKPNACDSFASRPAELAIAMGPRGDGAAGERFRIVGHDQPRIEVVGRSKPWQIGARAVRRVERRRRAGVISGIEMPQVTQASVRENSWSPPRRC
jgi:hypothetical protein